MIIWLNGCFGVGKTATANRLHDLIENSHIYDPEQVGAFLWDNFPTPLKCKGDFQDIELWRTFNYEYIKYIYHNFNGHIIIPMTLVNPDYYHEIIDRLQADGMELRHFILTAPKEIIAARLIRRGEKKGSWAEQQIDRCLKAFNGNIHGERVDTNKLTIHEAAEYILEKCFCS